MNPQKYILQAAEEIRAALAKNAIVSYDFQNGRIAPTPFDKTTISYLPLPTDILAFLKHTLSENKQ